jgi:DNA repair protein RecO (recombination protein O)
MSSVKTSAIVLKSINWKDTSKIITLFTREIGKINVIAKGARRTNSSYRGILESINLIEAVIYISANRQLQILGQTTLEDSFRIIRTDYHKTGYVFAILEITDKILHQGEGDSIFFDFLVTLMKDIQKISNPMITFWYFLLKISSYLGFRPEFKSCSICSGEIDTGTVIFSVRDGAVVCDNCCSVTGNEWKFSSSVRSFLYQLQKANHKTLSVKSFDVDDKFPFTDFLLNYLRFHSEEKLEISALKMFK